MEMRMRKEAQSQQIRKSLVIKARENFEGSIDLSQADF